MTNQQAKETLVTLLLSVQTANECLDDLKQTDFYKGKLKAATKQFEVQVQKSCQQQINNLFNHNSEASNEIIKGIEGVGKILSTMTPKQIFNFINTLENGDTTEKRISKHKDIEMVGERQ